VTAVDDPEPEATVEPEPAAELEPDLVAAKPWLRRGFAWMRRNAYLAVAVAAVLVVTDAVDFSPPDQVRVGQGDAGHLVGDAPSQEFSSELANPQAVQLRATLRLYPNNELELGAPDPDTDPQGRLLSQPVVTTLLGMNATIDQSVRLEGGDLEVDLVLHATPRLGTRPRGSKAPHPLMLEHELSVRSRRHEWWSRSPVHRVHVDSRGILTKVDKDGYRLVFTVDEHLFSVDLELHRSGTPLPDATLAGGG